MRTLSYQQADARDAERIFCLSQALIEEYEDVSAIDYDKVLAWMRRKIEHNISSYTRILADGRLAGYYRLVPDGGQMELDDVYVLEAFRNQGIGTQALQEMLCECERDVILYVFTKNVGAMRLYERNGFERSQSVSATRCVMVRRHAGKGL